MASYTHLTHVERYPIYSLMKVGQSLTEITPVLEGVCLRGAPPR